jgi:DNA-binding response OmpR family regulator
MKILIVDDDPSLLDQLQQLFINQRYTVETASDGHGALDKLFDTVFDLIVLDIMMPTIDGLAVLQELREGGIETPVLMLTAKGDAADKVKGLDLGADDYLSKPFSADELMARVRALLRRSGNQASVVLKAHDLELNTVCREVKRKGRPVALTPREFSILEFLLYNKNRVVSRFSLAEHVWGDDFDPFNMSNFMDVHIKNLRQKLCPSGEPAIIQTVRGVGFVIKDTEE